MRKKGAVVNTVAANATAKALVARSNNEYHKLFDLEPTTWTKSLIKRIGICKRVATNLKPEIPELAKREAKFLLQYQVANLVERYAAPDLMIMNSDQTPSKFASVSSQTLDISGNSHTVIAGKSIYQNRTVTEYF